MADLKVPNYESKTNSNFYAGGTVGSIIGYKNSGSFIPIVGATVGYEYKDKDNGGFHAGANLTAGTTLTAKANAGYEFRWGDFGLDLSANASGTVQTVPHTSRIIINNGANIEVDLGAKLPDGYVYNKGAIKASNLPDDVSANLVETDDGVKIDFNIPNVKEINYKNRYYDYNAGVLGAFVYHGKSEKADFNISAGVEAGYHGAGPNTPIFIKADTDFNVNINVGTQCQIKEQHYNYGDATVDITKTENGANIRCNIPNDIEVPSANNRRTPWYITPKFGADVTFGKSKEWTAKLDASMYEVTAGVAYNIPIGKNK